MNPKVSVIIPNYNHAPFLRQRIDSVLNQSFRDFELIVLDDCSQDNSRKIIESYRSRPEISHIVYNDTNAGSTFAQWKKGLALAKGEYIWIAESDDFATTDFLDSLVPLLDQNPSATMAFSGSLMVDADGKEIQGMDWDRFPSEAPETELMSGRKLIESKLLWTSDVYNASMVLFRRATAPAIEDHQLKMRYCGDWLFWVNTALRGDAVIMRRKLNRFRQHNMKVSPGANKEGLYFIEGLPIMTRIANALNLSKTQRAMLAGRTWRRLRKYPELLEKRRHEVMKNLDELYADASKSALKLSLLYTADKYLNFTKLQH